MLEDTVAKRVVHSCLRVHEDDMVLVETWQHTIDLASEIALECYRTGAKPLITLNTDRLWWGALAEIPEQYMRKVSRHVLSAVDNVTVWIALGGPEDPSKFRDTPASRLEILFEGDRPVLDKTFEKRVRTAELLLGHVTPQRAKAYGFDYERWMKMTEEAIKVDYSKLAELGRKMSLRLERGSKIRVTTKAGTDVRFETTKRPIHVQDGIVDQADIERGLVSTQLPSGKVEVAPLEESAKGTVVYDVPRALKGRLIQDLRLVFERGHIQEYKARKGEEVFREVFDAGQGDRDKIAQFTLGLNPKVDLIGYTTDELSLGTVTIGVGANKGIGGKNDSSFSFSGTVTKPTVEVDGQTIIVDGRITL